MSHPGRPKKLDQKKRAEVCALVSAGVTVRESARYVGCNRETIRQEAQRNEQFGRELERARSQARVHPLRTMHDAAAKNWRAAAWWLERLAPDEFANPGATVFGKREANRFARDLVDIVERSVANPLERERLYELLTAALPAAMRRTWDHRQTGRKLDRAIDYFNGKPPFAAPAQPSAEPAAQPSSQSPGQPEPVPEQRPVSQIERLLTSFNDELREMADAKKQSPPTRAAPAPPNKLARSENSLAHPARNSPNKLARKTKRGP